MEDTTLKNFWTENVASPVEQGVRGLFGYNTGETVGDFLKPSEIVKGGVAISPDNKIFNTKTPDEMQSYLTEKVTPSDNPDDRHLYRLRHPTTGEVKWGTAKGSASERYVNDPDFQGWIVEYDSPTKDAEDIENTIHGNQALYSQQDKGTSLRSGNTERVSADLAKQYYPTQTQQVAFTRAKDLLSPEQQQIASTVVSNANAKQAVASLQAMDEASGIGSFSPTGSMSEDKLYKLPQFQDEARYALSWMKNMDTKNLSDEQVGEQFRELASGYNWNTINLVEDVARMGNIPEEASTAFINAMDMYNTTDVSGSQVWEGTKNLLTDPLNILGLGGIVSAPAKAGAKEVIKHGAKVGTLEGATFTGADDAIRQLGDIKAGKQEDFDIGRNVKAIGAGAGGGLVLGSLISAITQAPHLLKSAQKKIKADPDAFVAEMEKDPQLAVKAKEIGLVDDTFPFFAKQTKEVVTKEQPAKTTVKADVVETVPKMKSGKKQPALAEHKKQMDTSSSKVVEPRVHEGKPVEGQVDVPKTDNEFTAEIGWDFRSRTYDESGKAINFQGGNEAKFSQAIQDRPKVTDIQTELDRRMKIYDSKDSLRKSYGDTQAKLKGAVKETSKTKDIANRRKFETDNLWDMSKDKSLSNKLRNEAKTKAEQISRVVDYKVPKEIIAKARKKHTEQYMQSSTEKQIQSRDDRMRQEFVKERLEGKETITPAKQKFLDKKDAFLEQKKSDLTTYLDQQIEELEPKWREASQSVEELSLAKGKKYSPEDKSSELTPHQKVIDEYTNLTMDRELSLTGDLSASELQHRLKSRVEDKQFEKAQVEFDNVADYKTWVEEQQTLQELLGLPHRKLPTFKETKVKADKGDYTPKPETDEDSLITHKSRTDAIKKKTAKLTSLERNLLREGIEPEFVANIKSPVGKPSELADLREFWTNKLVKQVNDNNRKTLGIGTEPVQSIKKIKATDSTTDFSNSVGQNVALLTADKDIGDVTKLTGTKDDIRTKIAERATVALGREIVKDDIKPLFMQQLYGQMAKGLIKTVKGDEALFNAYEKVMQKEYPAFYELSNSLYKLAGESKTGEFKYTLPDGVEIEFDLKGFDTGVAKIGSDKSQTIKVSTGRYNDFSRAMAPNIMHSIDGYMIRKIATILGREGIDTRTIHDAITFKGPHTERVKEVALQVQKELLESDVLHDIMTQLGYKGEPIKGKAKNTLTPEDLDKSYGKAMDFEHIAGEIEKKDAVRANENSRLLSDKELVKEYMASGNVKLAGTNQLVDYMITEAGYNSGKYATARTSDDAFELAIAEALQGKATTRLIPPKELSAEGKKLWIQNTKELLRETRAKAERNPMLREVVQGERKYFDKDGKSLLRPDLKTLDEIKTNEMRLYRKLLKSKTKREIVQLQTIEPNLNFERMQKKVYSWKTDNLTEAQMSAKKLVTEAKTPEETGYKKSFFRDQVQVSPESKEFDQLSMIYKTETDNVAKTAEWMQKIMDKMIPKKERENFTKHLLNTDYHQIQDFPTKESAMEYKKNFQDIYNKAEQFIKQSAKALNEESQQIGAYINNPVGIARHAGLSEDTAPIIDRLISIEAMTDDAWKWIDANKDSRGFKFAMNVISENKRKSKALFSRNSEDYVKGYTRESYEGNFKIENQKVMFDADAKKELGIIPITAESKKVGAPSKIVSEEELPKKGFATREEMIEFARENEMKVTDKGLRKVQNRELREEMGRSTDFNKILTETTASIDYKVAQRNIVRNIQNTALQESKLISNKPAKGFRELTEEETMMLPHDLKEVIKYVKQDYAERLLGRDEFRVYKGDKQHFKIADRVWKDFVTRFKQDVVLKNPASHVNAVVVNQTLGMTAGMNPVKNAKYSIQASKQMEANLKTMRFLALAKAEGKTGRIKALQSKLEKSELWKMEQMGLSTNLLEGVRGNSALLNDILSKATKGKLDTVTNLVLANQGSVIGDTLAKSFSHIDTQGRYALAKHFMDQGMSMEKAIKEANGLFGDMDKMAPAMIDAIDKYGFIPFMKWFSLTTPMLTKLVGNNPLKAMAVSIGMLYLSSAMNWNNASQNPVGAVADFAEQALTTDVHNQVEAFGITDTAVHRLTPYIVPSFYKRGYQAFDKEHKHLLFSEQMKKPKTEDFPDYRGITQKTIDLMKED